MPEKTKNLPPQNGFREVAEFLLAQAFQPVRRRLNGHGIIWPPQKIKSPFPLLEKGGKIYRVTGARQSIFWCPSGAWAHNSVPKQELGNET